MTRFLFAAVPRFFLCFAENFARRFTVSNLSLIHISFTAFLTTLGAVIAAWGGVMLADIALRHKDYDEPSLFTPSGRYGSVNWGAVVSLIVGSLVGWGLVVNASASWLSWQGYLLGPLGGRNGDWAGANIGRCV